MTDHIVNCDPDQQRYGNPAVAGVPCDHEQMRKNRIGYRIYQIEDALSELRLRLIRRAIDQIITAAEALREELDRDELQAVTVTSGQADSEKKEARPSPEHDATQTADPDGSLSVGCPSCRQSDDTSPDASSAGVSPPARQSSPAPTPS